ncbi:hypothetical protein [Flavicella sp.]|uniref:hypothetical protein n=1 Tax=Flavicella sp. TaxID=2957742 RepID=UPI00301AB0FF
MRLSLILVGVLFSSFTYAQSIPSNKIISIKNLGSFLKLDIQKEQSENEIYLKRNLQAILEIN